MNIIYSFLNWFWNGTIDQQVRRGKRTLAGRIRRSFHQCPACKKGFDGHRMAVIAVTTAEVGNTYRIDELKRALRSENWEEVVGFDESEMTTDLFIVEVISCKEGKAIWVITFEPFHLDRRSEIEEYGVLDENQAKPLLDIVRSDSWTVMK